MRAINPGEQLVYQFKAKHAGIFMCHCGTAPTLQTESWDAVVFNGYATQDKFRPIRVEPHQRLRVWVLDLQPAQGGFVEFSFDEPGLYPIVTHKFANVAKGALGLFQAGDVKATNGGH
jgi:nitrite reductase (NO-forming)